MSVSMIVDFGGEVCYNKGYEIQRVVIFCGGNVVRKEPFMRRVIICCVVFAVSIIEAARTGPWTKQRAWEWYNAQPWIRGCNYMPASCANRVDQWQELGSEERFKEMERELALAESIGFNTMRIIVELQGFGVWLEEHDGFMKRFERTLQMLAKHKMRAIIVLGNDCMRPKSIWKLPKPGPQSYDVGYHGGRKQSQHGSFPGEIGYSQVDDPVLKPKFFAMCEELMTKYRDDERILFWNLWNEPGNSRRFTASVKPMSELFELAWRIDPKQPLAADLWDEDFGTDENARNKAQVLAGRLSDIVSYHCYGDYERQIRVIRLLKKHYGRPMINTEWLARIKHNDVFSAYPLYYIERIGCTCWGFVAGKYQTYEPWESMWREVEEGSEIAKSYDMTKWFHDLYRPSFRPYDPKEIDLIKRFNKMADEDMK